MHEADFTWDEVERASTAMLLERRPSETLEEAEQRGRKEHRMLLSLFADAHRRQAADVIELGEWMFSPEGTRYTAYFRDCGGGSFWTDKGRLSYRAANLSTWCFAAAPDQRHNCRAAGDPMTSYSTYALEGRGHKFEFVGRATKSITYGAATHAVSRAAILFRLTPAPAITPTP